MWIFLSFALVILESLCYIIVKPLNTGEDKMSTIFQERLLEAMQIKGMTQKDLAMRIGVTEAAVSKYLHTDRKPHIDVISDMANVLQTTTDFLLGRVDAQDEFNLHGVKNLLARNAQKMTDEDRKNIDNTVKYHCEAGVDFEPGTKQQDRKSVV